MLEARNPKLLAAVAHLIPALLCAALLLAPFAAAQSSSGTVRRYETTRTVAAPDLSQAEAAIEKRDYATAEQLLQKVVGDGKANYQAWYDLGYVYNGLGRSDDSIAAYRKSVTAKPDVFESNLNLGLMLARFRQADAEQFLRAATKLTPTSHPAEGRARAWLGLAHILEASKPDDAIEACHQAAALQPKNPEPHLIAGPLLEKSGRYADAEQEYKQALAADPKSDDALTGLANIYMRGRRFPEAEEFLRKLAIDRPNDAVIHMQLGRVLAAEGKSADAITELEAASKLGGPDPALQRDLADLYVANKKYDLAEGQYRALLSANPRDAALHDELGKALLEQHKFPQAQQEFQIAVALKPDFGAAHGDLAFAASENKDYGRVIFELDKRKEFLPEIPITYFLRASAYDHLRDIKKARENYQLFLDGANGKYPDQEWQAKHRLIALEPKR
ncbi:MAG TPA: tetratricopeptide repeat protein [Terriglobales bacterium]|nr:tetratricopeptide repeat protein [Terriglobales bacterium]